MSRYFNGLCENICSLTDGCTGRRIGGKDTYLRSLSAGSLRGGTFNPQEEYRGCALTGSTSCTFALLIFPNTEGDFDITMLHLTNDVLVLIYERLSYRSTLSLACTCQQLSEIDMWSRKLAYHGWIGRGRPAYKRYAASGIPKVFSFHTKQFVPLHKNLVKKNVTRLAATAFANDIWVVALTVEGKVYVSNSQGCNMLTRPTSVLDLLVDSDTTDLYICLVYEKKSLLLRMDEQGRVLANEYIFEPIQELLAMKKGAVFYIRHDGRISHSFDHAPYEKIISGNELIYKRVHFEDKVGRVILTEIDTCKDGLLGYAPETEDFCSYGDILIVLSKRGVLSIIDSRSMKIAAKEVIWMRSTLESSLLCFTVSRE